MAGDILMGQALAEYWLYTIKKRLAELRDEKPHLWFTVLFTGPGKPTFFGMDYRATRENRRDELVDAKCPARQLEEKLDEFEAAKAALAAGPASMAGASSFSTTSWP